MPGTASPAPPALGTATPVSNRVSGKAGNAETVPSWTAANEQKWKILLMPHSQTLHFLFLFFFPGSSLLREEQPAPFLWDSQIFHNLIPVLLVSALFSHS